MIKIDENLCEGKGTCTRICTKGLIGVRDGKAFLDEDAGEKCINCGHCMVFCPMGAISLDGQTSRNAPKVNQYNQAKFEDLAQLMRSRRSVRHYKKDLVERNEILKLLDVVRFAPSSLNLQPVQWTVILEPETLHELSLCAVEVLRRNKVFAHITTAWDEGKNLVLYNAPALILAHAAADAFRPETDCAIALTYLELLAASSGLGACWVGHLIFAFIQSSRARDLVSLPSNHVVQGALMLGYPKYPLENIPPRNEVKVAWIS